MLGQAATKRMEVPIDLGASPASRSAAVGKEVPLSEEERTYLDRKAQELGIIPAPEGDGGAYTSMDAALAAGTPVPGQHNSPVRDPHGVVKLPDFTKVDGINLILDVFYVDGMEFPIDKRVADGFRLWAIQTASGFVMEKMNAARDALTKITAEVAVKEVEGGGDEKVHKVRRRKTSK
jgi:hypothetical protein